MFETLSNGPLSLQALYGEEAQDAVVLDDGEVKFQRPDGQYESWDERQARLAHNTKMRFHRSLQSSLLANAIVRAYA